MGKREKDRLMKEQQPNKASTAKSSSKRAKASLVKTGGVIGVILVLVILALCWFRNYVKPVYLMPELWTEISGDFILDEAGYEPTLLELRSKLEKTEKYLNSIVASDFSGFKQSLIQWATSQINKEEVKGYITELWAKAKSGFRVALPGQMEEMFTDISESMIVAVDQIGSLIEADLATLEEKGPRRSVLLLGEKQLAFYDFSSAEMVSYIQRQIEELNRVIDRIERAKKVGATRLARISRTVEAIDQYFTFETRTRVELDSGEGLIPAAKEMYLAINQVRLLHDTYWDEKLTGIPQERLIAALEEFYHQKVTGGAKDEVRVTIPLGPEGELVIEPHLEATATIRGPLAALKCTNHPLVSLKKR